MPARLWRLAFLLLTVITPALAQVPGTCDPTNYTKVDDANPNGLPYDFCAYTYLPWRVKLPENPSARVSQYTNAIQNYYAKGSGSAIDMDAACSPTTPVSSDGHKHCPNGINYMVTTARKPTAVGQGGGSGNRPTYKAKSTDPHIHIVCYCFADANGMEDHGDGRGKIYCPASEGTGGYWHTAYGCSDMNGNNYPYGTIIDAQIPAYARETGNRVQDSDVMIGIIQPDGKVLDFGGCVTYGGSSGAGQSRDWQDGDYVSVPGPLPTPCNSLPYGAAYGDIVHDKGHTTGTVNAGDSMTALPVTYNEILQGQINHALHVFGSCFTPQGVYPGTLAGICADQTPGTVVPVGQLFFLDLSIAQINALSASNPEIIPPYLLPFARAAHEHGVYMLDTGVTTQRWMSQFMLSPTEPSMYAGTSTTSPWINWFLNNCGPSTGDTVWPCGEGGDALMKMGFHSGQYIDWSAPQIRDHLIALDPCYAQGSCSDSVSDPQGSICTCGTPNCGACTGTPPPPPLALWPFNEGVGTVTHTSTTPDRPLALSGPGTLWGAGHTGTSLQCQDQGVATLTPFTTGGPYAWAFWFQPMLDPTTTYVQQPLDAADGWGFSWGHVNAAFRMEAFHRLAAGTYVGVTLTPTPTLGQWSYLTGTWDGTTLSVYLNGKFAGQVAASALYAATGDLRVCFANYVGTPTGMPYARIDDLTLWTSALTPDQVLGAYQGLTPTPTPFHARRHATSLGLK